MKIDLRLVTELQDTFRSNRVRSMYNVEPSTASTHEIHTDVPIEDRPWSVGLVVGPSGTGKTSVGRALGGIYAGAEWPADKPVIDAIGPDSSVDDAAGALAAVGLGSVPSWLRPYHVLSGGERFRADLARILLGEPGTVIYDEFTSVVDRTVAKVGAAAFAKAWRRRTDGARFVALSCHRDVEEWLCPDWVLDTEDWSFSWRSLRRPPSISVELLRTDRRAWPAFERHHYLKAGPVVGAYYIGAVDGEAVCHVAVSRSATGSVRLTRLVVMPEWQGAGIGLRFLDAVAEGWRTGVFSFDHKPARAVRIHTSHPGLIAGLARRPGWQREATILAKGRPERPTSHVNRRMTNGHTRAVSQFIYTGCAA